MLLTTLLIFQVITFVGLVFALRKLMFNASATETQRLRDISESNLKRSAELTKKLNDADDEHQRKMAQSQAQLAHDQREARIALEEERDAAITRARNEAQLIVDNAVATKEKIREKLEEGLTERAMLQARILLGEILNARDQDWLHRGFIEDLIVDLDRFDSDKFSVTGDVAIIKTPKPLDDKLKNALTKTISDKVGHLISIQEEVDPSIVSGIVITIDHLVLDGSLPHRLEEASKVLGM